MAHLGNTIINGVMRIIGGLYTNTINGVAVGDSPKFTDTTYTFTGGTNKFTVTPSTGSATDVTITPSISNNVTGSGTSGKLAKWNGANTVTDGPALSAAISSQTQSTKFLREDGTWNAPSYTTSAVSKSAAGLCPQLPNETTTTKYLRQDGTWVTPPNDKGVTSVTIQGDSGAISVDSTDAITGTGTRTISHSTAAGYKHIPSGGSSGKILVWSSAGTAAWGDVVITSSYSNGVLTISSS